MQGLTSSSIKVMERTVWRTLDLWILPVASMFYLLSFLLSPCHFLFRCRLGIGRPIPKSRSDSQLSAVFRLAAWGNSVGRDLAVKLCML
jgi:hypothetical protein